MTPEVWANVDRYIVESIVKPDAVLDAVLASSAAAGLPAINVSPAQGKLLHLLARGSRRILEIGTLGGYSTIWLARALAPGGTMVTLEINPHHAQVARANLERAGLSAAVEIRVGPALETLPRLGQETGWPFDLVFLDADKPSNTEYFVQAIRMTRPGGLIVVDNVVRQGGLADAASSDPNVLGVRRLHEWIANDSRVSATTIQMVGSKGYDGMTIAAVIA